MLSVFGYDDAPHGHGHISCNDVRVPLDHIVLGPGKGFEIIQGRLGPGRIHHAMRSIGAAEKALDYFLARINDGRKKPFGKLLSEHGIMLERIAQSRIEIDAARLVVLNAAIAIDNADAKAALKEIAIAKVLVPQALLATLDRAIQAYGAAGVCQDTPLAKMYANGRTMRIVDGPDEVHMLQLGRNENKRAEFATKRIEAQRKKGLQLLDAAGLSKRDPLFLGRESNKAKL
jgi:acyl-CoA dehydrogenase